MTARPSAASLRRCRENRPLGGGAPDTGRQMPGLPEPAVRCACCPGGLGNGAAFPSNAACSGGTCSSPRTEATGRGRPGPAAWPSGREGCAGAGSAWAPVPLGPHEGRGLGQVATPLGPSFPTRIAQSLLRPAAVGLNEAVEINVLRLPGAQQVLCEWQLFAFSVVSGAREQDVPLSHGRPSTPAHVQLHGPEGQPQAQAGTSTRLVMTRLYSMCP